MKELFYNILINVSGFIFICCSIYKTVIPTLDDQREENALSNK